MLPTKTVSGVRSRTENFYSRSVRSLEAAWSRGRPKVQNVDHRFGGGGLRAETIEGGGGRCSFSFLDVDNHIREI